MTIVAWSFMRSVSRGLQAAAIRWGGDAPRARPGLRIRRALVVAGAICATLIGGSVGDALAIGLITLGLGAALLLIFFEVGQSEDRELARDEKRRRQRSTDGNAGGGVPAGRADPGEERLRSSATSRAKR
jgi:hypothetical protein